MGGKKRNEVLIYVTTWIKLEISMLGEKSQTQGPRHYMIQFILSVQNKQVYRNRNIESWLPRTGGW